MADLVVVPADVLKVSGSSKRGIAGAYIRAGTAVYQDSADSGKLKKADSNDTSATAAAVGISLNEAAPGQYLWYLPPGGVVDLGVTLTVGEPYFLSATGNVNEEQTVVIDATGGTFTISFGGNTTSALAYNASAATVKAALEALASIGTGNIDVSLGGATYTLTFQNRLGGQNVAQVTTGAGSLTGGASTATPATTVPGTSAGGIAPRADITTGWRTVLLGVALTADNFSINIFNSDTAHA